MNEAEVAYVAGLFDGEGTVGFNHRNEEVGTWKSQLRSPVLAH